MPSVSYTNFRLERAKQNFDYLGGVMKVLIVDNTYTFDAGHKFVDDITGELVNDVGTGYERKTLAGKDIVIPAGTDIVRYLADNPVWEQINTTTDGTAMIAYLEVTDDTDSLLMSHNDGVDLATNGSDIEAKLEDGAVHDDTDAAL